VENFPWDIGARPKQSESRNAAALPLLATFGGAVDLSALSLWSWKVFLFLRKIVPSGWLVPFFNF